jgi:hypothetical protein
MRAKIRQSGESPKGMAAEKIPSILLLEMTPCERAERNAGNESK